MTAYLDGAYLPLAEARISPLDRGFLFGDGAYEVVPVYSRRPFRLDEHLRRLQTSLDGIRLTNPHRVEEWRSIILRIIDEAGFDDQTVYIQVTRGADTKRDQAFPKGVAPTVFLFTAPLFSPTPEQREAGVAAITVILRTETETRRAHKNIRIANNRVTGAKALLDASHAEGLTIENNMLEDTAGEIRLRGCGNVRIDA